MNSWKENFNDWRNDNKKRTIQNTDNLTFNCGGYALKTFNWYRPYTYLDEIEDYIYEINEILSEEEIATKILNYTFSQILQDFPELIEINEEDIKNYTCIIAYRVGFNKDLQDWDFHFKIYENDKWSEKNGTWDIVNCDLNKDEYWQCPGDIFTTYNSEIKFLTYK